MSRTSFQVQRVADALEKKLVESEADIKAGIGYMLGVVDEDFMRKVARVAIEAMGESTEAAVLAERERCHRSWSDR